MADPFWPRFRFPIIIRSNGSASPRAGSCSNGPGGPCCTISSHPAGAADASTSTRASTRRCWSPGWTPRGSWPRAETPSPCATPGLRCGRLRARVRLLRLGEALADWDGPEPGERPSAYIVVCRDRERALADTFTAWDEGIAAQTIMLQAAEAGYGGCMVGSFKRRSLCEAVGLDEERFRPDLVLALGKPVEDVRIVEVPKGGATEYWRDEAGVHYVPKRALSDVLL
ncbi:MAG: nitroreductase family protein [Eggerthellaceae bacterium]